MLTAARKNLRTVRQESPLIVTRAPHLKSSDSISRRMGLMILALIPVAAGSAVGFGWGALWVLFHCAISAILFEFAAEKIFKRPVRIWDGSVLLVSFILGMNLPSDLPWWMCWVASFFAVFVTRELSGGLARNRFHPALVGLAVLYFLYPVAMGHNKPLVEAFPFLIGLSAAFVIFKRVIHWHSSAVYLISFFLCAWILGDNPWMRTFSGTVLLAAFFIVTDSVTTPLTRPGEILFSVLAGILTGVLAYFAGLQEGVVFGILIMNAWVPLIDKYVKIGVSGAGFKKMC